MFDYFRPKVASRSAQRKARLAVELLEPRNLLSANSVTAVTAHPIVANVNLPAASLASTTSTPAAPMTSPTSTTIAVPLGNILLHPQRTVKPDSSGGSSGYTPTQITQAYGFNQIQFKSGTTLVKGDGTGQTIAIVDATYDPNIANDLHTFDVKYGLTDPTLVTHTMAPISQMPQDPAGWGGEISLDVEWAHAIAPGASILLVEAKSASIADLLAGVDYAASYQGAIVNKATVAPTSVVSMSFGENEVYIGSVETSYDSHFKTPLGHSNVSFVASSGDSGSGVSWPSISSKVLSVGGTSLTINGSGSTFTYGGETGWSGSGGGYSQYINKPAYQNGVQPNATKRSNPDVAYDADPNTGFNVYESAYGGSSGPGWFVVGGTGAGSPQWAALVAIADQGRKLAGSAPLANVEGDVYALPSGDFHDITSGSNGGFTAHTGYDLVTGLGSPRANKVVVDLITSTDMLPTGGGRSGGGTSSSGGGWGGVHNHAIVGDSGSTITISGTGTTNPGGDNHSASAAIVTAEANSLLFASTPTQTTTLEAGKPAGAASTDATLAAKTTTTALPVNVTAETTFASLNQGDWQSMTQSAWGYQPGRSSNSLPWLSDEEDSAKGLDVTDALAQLFVGEEA